MKMIVALALGAISLQMSGCAIKPMTPEERAQNERTIEALKLLNQQFNKPRPAPAMPAMPVTCRSQWVGNTLQTVCN